MLLEVFEREAALHDLKREESSLEESERFCGLRRWNRLLIKEGFFCFSSLGDVGGDCFRGAPKRRLKVLLSSPDFDVLSSLSASEESEEVSLLFFKKRRLSTLFNRALILCVSWSLSEFPIPFSGDILGEFPCD